MGVTIPEVPRRRRGVPDTHPLVRMDASQRLQHTLRLSDETTPDRRLRPPRAVAAEVWCTIGDTPPADRSELRLLAVARRSVVRLAHSGDDAGKTAHYMVRWVNARDEHGPWSQTASATIVG